MKDLNFTQFIYRLQEGGVEKTSSSLMDKIKDTITSGFAQKSETLLTYVGKFFLGIIMILVGFILAKIFKKIILRILGRIKLDELFERLNINDALASIKIKISPTKFVASLIYYIVLFLFFTLTADFLKIEIVSKQLTRLFEYLPHLISSLLIFILGIFIADKIKNGVFTAVSSIGVFGARIISNFVFYSMLIFISITALNQAQIDTELITSNLIVIFACFFGAFAIAYGYSSRDILSNILSSYYGKDRFRLGEIIRVDGYTGEIVKMDSIAVTLQTEEGLKVVIPCKRLISENIEILTNTNNNTENHG